jgi:hypothetical protein
MSKSPDDPNVVDLTDMVRVNDDEEAFDSNAVDYHPEGSPYEFATKPLKPLKVPAASASGDDDDDKFAPDLGDDAEDFPDPDLSLLDDYVPDLSLIDDYVDDDECLERTGDIDDEDITGEAQADDVDNPDDSGALCLSPVEASIGIEADGISNHCGPIALMDDHQSIEDVLSSIPLPKDYIPGKFRALSLSADEPKPISEVVRTSGVRQSFDDFLSSIPISEDYVPGKFRSSPIND